jgi:FAD/FMN-containing dehydrogenase
MNPSGTALGDLDGVIDGRVLTPESPDYDAARRSFVAGFDAVAPQAIAQCTSPQDVATAIVVARRHGVPFAPRSGGHCYAGRSSTTGLLIDVSPMRAISVAHGRATIGAGARLGEVYEHLLDHDLTVPGGSCPTVGIAGLTLGGGFGILGRTHGLCSDHLLGAEVVLADGRIVTCDTGQHTDLHWALRGAGGARFGIVTSFDFELVPATPATNFRVGFRPEDAAAVLDAWQHWAPTAPDELTASLLVRAVGEAGQAPSVEVIGAMSGTEADVDGLVDELVAAAARDPIALYRETMSHRDTRSFWARLDGGELTRHGHRFHKSGYFRRPLPSGAITTLVDHFNRTGAIGRYRELDFSPWGGAYNRVPHDATAFAHRDQLFLLKHTAEVHPDSSVDEKQAAREWARRSWATVHSYGSGAVYPNFPDPVLGEWHHCYHGRNLERLLRIKAAYDPTGAFIPAP